MRDRGGDMRDLCCGKEAGNAAGNGDDCDSVNWPKGPAFNSILEMAANETTFYENYRAAWARATN